MMPHSCFSISRRAVFALPMLALAPRFAFAASPIIDVLGRSVPLTKPAERVVVGFYADEYGAIAGPGGWERVVGLSKRQWVVNRNAVWRRYLAAVPRLGEIDDIGSSEDQSFSSEKVIALKPDVFITPSWEYTASPAAMASIEAAGIPILTVDYNAQNPEKHAISTLAIGEAIGMRPRAEELANLYRSQVADIQARAKKAGTKPKVYVEIGMNGPNAVGNSYKNTMWGRMLDLVGAENIANDAMPAASGYQPIAPEKVLAAEPDFIIITGSSWAGKPNSVRLGYDVDLETARVSLHPNLARPGWDTLPAVKAGNVFTIEHSLTRSLMDWISMQYIAKQLYPAQFADVDPVGALKAYHERYLPIAFSGTWMARLS